MNKHEAFAIWLQGFLDRSSEQGLNTQEVYQIKEKLNGLNQSTSITVSSHTLPTNVTLTTGNKVLLT